jgi:hypothetical protein
MKADGEKGSHKVRKVHEVHKFIDDGSPESQSGRAQTSLSKEMECEQS